VNVKSRKRDDGSVLEAQVVWDLSYTDLSFVPFRKARVDKRQMNLTKRPRVDPMTPAVDRLCHAACLSGRCSPAKRDSFPLDSTTHLTLRLLTHAEGWGFLKEASPRAEASRYYPCRSTPSREA